MLENPTLEMLKTRDCRFNPTLEVHEEGEGYVNPPQCVALESYFR